jgi:hypothetical protein
MRSGGYLQGAKWRKMGHMFYVGCFTSVLRQYDGGAILRL